MTNRLEGWSALVSEATDVLASSVAGQVPRDGSGAYNATKHTVGAFGEALRQEVTQRHVRFSLVEAGDIADAITYIVARPRRMTVNGILICPTEQLA